LLGMLGGSSKSSRVGVLLSGLVALEDLLVFTTRFVEVLKLLVFCVFWGFFEIGTPLL
jgi:hypothetical protein